MTQLAATEILGEYINHIGICADAMGNVFSAVTQYQKLTNKTDLVITRRDHASTLTVEIYRFTEAEYAKHGYGDCVVLKDGSLLIAISEANPLNQVRYCTRIVPASIAHAVFGTTTQDIAARQSIALLTARLQELTQHLHTV